MAKMAPESMTPLPSYGSARSPCGLGWFGSNSIGFAVSDLILGGAIKFLRFAEPVPPLC